MSGLVVAVVLFAALLHASWNAIVKAGKDTFLTTVLVSAGAALISLAVLPFVNTPAPASWPYLAASSVAQLAYYSLLAAAYKAGDMSHAYPLMRGSAPLLVALASWPLIGERLSSMQMGAVACISAGIFALYLAMSPSSVGTLPVLPSIMFLGSGCARRPVSSATPGNSADNGWPRHGRCAASRASGCDTR